MDSEAVKYGYEVGDRCIALCWKGQGQPKEECAHRSWEVRVLEVRKRTDGALAWFPCDWHSTAFWGDYSQVDAAKVRAKVACERTGLPYVISADIGRTVDTLEDVVIKALKELF